MPRAIEAICLRAMAKDPAKRYQTTKAFHDDLSNWQKGRVVSACPQSLPVRFLISLNQPYALNSAIDWARFVGLFVTIWTTIACLVFTAVGVAAFYQFIASVASPTVAKTCLVVVTLPVIFVCRWIFRRLRRL